MKSKKSLKIIISLYLSIPIFIYILIYAKEIKLGGHIWKTGDWLINYEAGLIRRGLTGQLYIYLSEISNINILLISFLFQSFIYISIFIIVLFFYFKKERDYLWLTLLLSPAFIIIFPFYDLYGGFRKEILGFLSFSILLIAIDKKSIILLITSTFLYTIAVFSHELNCFLLPFFVYVIFSQNTATRNKKNSLSLFVKNKEEIFWASLFFIISLIALAISFYHSGSKEDGEIICQSLLNIGLKEHICDGSLLWIGRDTTFGYNLVTALFLKGEYDFYIFYIILSLAPFLFFRWTYQKKIYLLAIISISFLLPLFIVAIDWGRWIHIFITMFTLLALFESSKNPDLIQPIIKTNPTIKVLLIFSFLAWKMEHCCNPSFKIPIFNIIKNILSF